jgi:peroxiredoxin/outer membrane lipoprotein-sorting protein
MKRLPLSLPLAALLSAPLVLPAGAAVPATPLAPRALVDSVAAHYAGLSAYHFEGQVHIAVTGDSLPQPFGADIPFVYAVRMPSRVHVAMENAQYASLVVADGESIWVSVPSAQQYLVQAAPHLAPGTTPAPEMAQALRPLLDFAALGRRATSVGDLGRDTVHTFAGTVECRRLALAVGADSSGRGDVPRRHVLWIDEARRLVLRDSLSAEFDRPGQGHIVSAQVMRFALADDAGPGPDSLYRFRAPGGSRRVAQFGPPPPAQAAMVGKVAKPFTLTGLDGTRVALAAQRGKIVVLDFWATWCGPCRRWMPVVAGIERQLKGRDVRFWAVNVRESAATVKAFVAQAKLTVPVLLDPAGKTADDYGADSIPLTVVIGRDGKVAQVLLGLHTEDDLRAALRQAGVRGL